MSSPQFINFISLLFENFTASSFTNEIVFVALLGAGCFIFWTGELARNKCKRAHRRGDKEKGPRDNAPGDLLCVYF